MSTEVNAPENTEVIEEAAVSEEAITQEEVAEEVVAEPVEAEGAVEEEAYTPNLKYSIKDKEYEFDEWARDHIVDKETEDKFRDLFTKASGIDEIKTDRDQYKESYATTKEKLEVLDQQLAQLGTYISNKDYGSFAKALQIPKEDLIQFAIEELKYQELPPEQRQYIDQQRQERERLASLEYQNQMLSQQSQQMVQERALSELNMELSKPEVSQLAQEYDARVGQPGAFRQEVINRGAYHEAVNKKVITAGQAVNEVVNLLGGSIKPQADSAPSQQPSSQRTVAANQKPVIPNIGGSSGSSPSGKVYNSIEDLIKRRDELVSQNA
jgi:hypothetical protein